VAVWTSAAHRSAPGNAALSQRQLPVTLGNCLSPRYLSPRARWRRDVIGGKRHKNHGINASNPPAPPTSSPKNTPSGPAIAVMSAGALYGPQPTRRSIALNPS
jgi:hypothetical protein